MNTNSKSRQRKIYVAILAVALGGLVVDRVVLEGGATGPSASEASDLSSLPAVSASAAVLTQSPVNPAARTKTLASRLSDIAKTQNLDPSQVEDAFRPAAGWIEQRQSKTAPVAVVNDVQAFTDKHKLLALINNPQGGAAIINNQTIVPGKTIDGFTLVEVAKRSAFFERDGQRIELKLPAPAGSLTAIGD